ncbi:protein spire homolog 2-like isoform X2 [Octopus sinensis]|uniref:Protein spire homolog 2-like isoform X2 n=1 Tax=Octopus sinensis TaxID=2607531 RepID=A0A6P7T9S2_9MOLL|nr:protein spire homolog 2-like isoform X2 [Octopus sinensis]
MSLRCQRLSARHGSVMAANCAADDGSDEESTTRSHNNQNRISLARVLKIFTSSISEEQAWAICNQCSKYFLNTNSKHNGYRILTKHRLDGLHIQKDGEVVIKSPQLSRRKEDNYSHTPEEHISESDLFKDKSIIKDKDIIQVLGLVVFQALDHGLAETEEHNFSTELESLIEYMTTSDTDVESDDSHTVDDEGIVRDGDDDGGEEDSLSSCNFETVLQMCKNHLSSSSDASLHYRAVCRALFTEAHELVTFLDKVSTGQKILQKQRQKVDELEALERSDWARLWIQIMKQLRHGVKLKKVDHSHQSFEGEYELTPYEILMKDIVFKRYRLNKIMVNGDIPPKVKHDAHTMILDFIRSRPPLHPMKDRVVNKLPPRSPDPHEKLLIEIRSQPKLRPIKEGKVLVETSRTKLNIDDEEESPLPVRKVIKPDFNLILDNSFEVDDEELSCREGSENKDTVKRQGKQDHSTDKNAKLVRRHTIMVCESPTEAKTSPIFETLQMISELEESPDSGNLVKSLSSSENISRSVGNSPTTSDRNLHVDHSTKSNVMHVSWTSSSTHTKEHQRSLPYKDYHPLSKKWQNPIECLSLTLDEVMHIRQVLTKAELESLLAQPQLYDLVSRGKVCFSCKSVKFSLFSQWGNNCQFCKRVVCNKCIRKMHVPAEHFNRIPVYTLSPSPPISPIENNQTMNIFTSTGTGSLLSPKKNGKSPKRRPLQRSQTISDKLLESKSRVMKGSLMNVCCDCKEMVCEVIQASRVSLSLVKRSKELSETEPKKASKVGFVTDSM